MAVSQTTYEMNNMTTKNQTFEQVLTQMGVLEAVYDLNERSVRTAAARAYGLGIRDGKAAGFIAGVAAATEFTQRSE